MAKAGVNSPRTRMTTPEIVSLGHVTVIVVVLGASIGAPLAAPVVSGRERGDCGDNSQRAFVAAAFHVCSPLGIGVEWVVRASTIRRGAVDSGRPWKHAL